VGRAWQRVPVSKKVVSTHGAIEGRGDEGTAMWHEGEVDHGRRVLCGTRHNTPSHVRRGLRVFATVRGWMRDGGRGREMTRRSLEVARGVPVKVTKQKPEVGDHNLTLQSPPAVARTAPAGEYARACTWTSDEHMATCAWARPTEAGRRGDGWW
jgi:hypothetical protein